MTLIGRSFLSAILVQNPAEKPDRDARRTLTVRMKCARQDFLRRSRISVSNATSADGFGGAAGAASSFRFKVFMARITRNSTKATMMKLIVSVRKLPQASTAPCFLASAKLVAVTFADKGVK